MRDMDHIIRRVLPRVTGAALPVIVASIREAADEFCRRTRLWRGEDEFVVSATGDEVTAVPTEAALFEIESARFDGEILDPVSLAWLDDHVPRWRELTATLAKWITQTAPDSVRVVPAATGTLELALFLKPAVDAERLPDFLIDHHADVLAHGALADLLSMPAEYANPGLAQYHRMRFDTRLDELIGANLKGQQRAAVRTAPRFF